MVADPDADPEMTQRTLVESPPLATRPSHDKERGAGRTRKVTPSTTTAAAATSTPAKQAPKLDKSRRDQVDTAKEVPSRVEDAPFRNRSRPVEPPQVPVSTRASAREREEVKDQGDVDVNGETEPVPSSELEVEGALERRPRPKQGQTSTSRRPTSAVAATHEEERAVADLLDDGASARSIGSSVLSKDDDDDVLPSSQDISEDEELDDDDKDTDRMLLEATGPRPLRHIENAKQEDVEDDSDSSSWDEDDEDIEASIAMLSRTRLAFAPRPGTRMQMSTGSTGAPP